MPRELTSEYIFFTLASCLIILVPVLTVDMFPFSTMPMFSDAPERISVVTVYDSNGKMLDPISFSLHSKYLANQNPKIGKKLPEPIVSESQLLDETLLKNHMREELKKFPSLAAVKVEQKIYGAIRIDGRLNA